MDTYWIDWVDPADGNSKYLAVSAASGHYWTEDTQDPNIVDGLSIPTKYEPEDTLRQIGEKWKDHDGRQYERHNLFKHPLEHAWIAVMKLPNGERDEESGKLTRTYQAFWSRRFKNVVCLHRMTGKCQGNPSFQDKGYAVSNAAKARVARKKKLENIESAAKRLNFNPAEQLIAWAQGDEEKLNTKQPITNAQRIKCLELLTSYTWAKPKPVDPVALEKAKQESGSNGPTVHITLPSNSREMSGAVLEHKDSDTLDKYFQETYKEPDVVNQVDEEAGEYDEETGGFGLPSNGR